MKRRLKWLWLTMFPPVPDCPRHGTRFHVIRGNREEGRRTFRCLACCIKFDLRGNRYLWDDTKKNVGNP